MNSTEASHTTDLVRRLAEAEATIKALLSGQIDAVIDAETQTPILLSTAQDALRASEDRYRRIVETANEGISIVDRESTFTFVNRRFANMLGYSTDELIGTSLFAIMSDAGGMAAARRIERPRLDRSDDSDDSDEHEVAYLRKDGSELWTLLKTTAIRDADGTWVGTLDMTTDWTRHRQDEQALRTRTADLVESEGRFRQLAETIHEVFFLTDLHNSQMFYVSPAYERLFGRTCESLYVDPRSWSEAVHPDDRKRALEQIAPQQSVVPFDVECRILHSDGSERSVRARGYPVAHAAGDTIRFAGVIEDITERKALEAQFRQAQKMEGIGRLAGGIAHDFNNLLTAIIGFGEMTLAQLPPDGQIREDVRQMVSAGQSAASLTRQLLAFSRQQAVEPIVLDLNTRVSGMQSLLRRLIGEDVKLLTTLGVRMRRIKADPSQIEQVIINLAVNARDAMPSGGTLRIVTETVEVDAAFVAAHSGAVKGPHARLRLSDTGIGMGPDVLAHLFEPFFTTKERGKGTGLGLATVYGIVKQNGGHIWVDSTPGEGSSFTIDFPCIAVEPQTVASAKTTMGVLDGIETVLVVDDQPELRMVVRMTLQRHGYDVLEAADGPAALKLLDACHRPVHLLLTDVVMPSMSGPELFDNVARHDGATRILYMSGYTDEALLQHGVLQAGVEMVLKPFTPNQLLARVRAVLDRPDPRQGL